DRTGEAPASSPALEGATDHLPSDHTVHPALTLICEGETWLVRVGTASVRLKDSRGIRYVARLVAEAGREIHALDLAASGGEADGGDAGEPLDAAAIATYKRRLGELDEEAREAEEWNDSMRQARIRSEIEFLSTELSRATGLGGRN